jgi:hypothetical protein
MCDIDGAGASGVGDCGGFDVDEEDIGLLIVRFSPGKIGIKFKREGPGETANGIRITSIVQGSEV